MEEIFWSAERNQNLTIRVFAMVPRFGVHWQGSLKMVPAVIPTSSSGNRAKFELVLEPDKSPYRTPLFPGLIEIQLYQETVEYHLYNDGFRPT